MWTKIKKADGLPWLFSWQSPLGNRFMRILYTKRLYVKLGYDPLDWVLKDLYSPQRRRARREWFFCCCPLRRTENNKLMPS